MIATALRKKYDQIKIMFMRCIYKMMFAQVSQKIIDIKIEKYRNQDDRIVHKGNDTLQALPQIKYVVETLRELQCGWLISGSNTMYFGFSPNNGILYFFDKSKLDSMDKSKLSEMHKYNEQLFYIYE